MRIKNIFAKFSFRYALYGALIGLFFPILATYVHYGELTIENCPFVYSSDKIELFYIIDLAPFVLALFAWFAGTKRDRIENQNSLLNQRFNLLMEQKQKIIESANMSEKFMAKMSHELRTPMNSIIGLSELLKESTLNGQQQKHADVILKESQQLLELINDVLDLSKLNSDKFQFNLNPFSLEELLNDKITALELKARKAESKLSLIVDAKLSNDLIGDKRRMAQIVTNILDNSLKYTQNGKVELKVFVAKDTDNEQIIQFDFIDNGIGMKQENLEKVFGAFVQLEAGGSNTKGTGLGLSIVHELVSGMNGTIKLNSDLGKGTKISIVIPFEKRLEKNALGNEKQKDKSFDLSDCTVLIVEDNMFNLYLLETILSKWNIKTSTAENGQLALDMLQNKTFDLVFMDFQMPVMNGIEATKQIRTVLKLDVPIIGLSAVTMESEVQEGYDAGMNDYLPKPIDRALLKEKMIKAIIR